MNQFLCHFLDNLSPHVQALGCYIPDIVILIHYHMSLNMNSNPAMHPSFRLLKILLNIDVNTDNYYWDIAVH